jgi:hypothetical protein
MPNSDRGLHSHTGSFSCGAVEQHCSEIGARQVRVPHKGASQVRSAKACPSDALAVANND